MNRNSLKKLFGWFFAVAALSLLAACSSESKIVGKWKEIGNKSNYVEFFKDGTVRVVQRPMPPMTGNYRFIDSDKIRIDLGGLGALAGPIILKVSVDDDIMTVTLANGKVEKLQRVE